MPNRVKRLPRRRKTNIECNSFPKRNLKVVKNNGVPEVSGSFAEKRSCSPCRISNTKDKGGVLRLLSPFNRFANNSTRTADKHTSKKMAYQSINHSTGLSNKEKSYIICSCQSRSHRYMKLKSLAAHAINNNKIFSVYGSCNAVRKALLERGWVEKIPPNRMNLSKIKNGTFSSKSDIHGELERLLLSNLVEKYNPNFVWRTKEEQHDTTIDMTKENATIVNKLKIDAMWTSKQGLCSSMKINYWFYIEDVAEVNGPRTYNSYDVGEKEDFIKDYKITACTSLLKWVLSMVANERPVFVETGNISINVMVFALNRCKEYLFRKQHKDIDRSVTNASSGQWNAFMKKYYRIIAKEDVFQVDHENKLPLYLGYAKFLLKEIHKYRPQLSCEGCHNMWIIKPAHCSRGRGIRLASKLGVITNLLNKANAKYVVQKYIEEPLLVHETKFDIRQYYLITSTYPLVIWMYQDCYLKFSSQKYSLKDYHESIHLTNNAVQRKYKNCLGRHGELPHNNMWDSDQYKDYLNSIGKNNVWDNLIYPGMKYSIIGIMLSCQDSLSVCKNRFELYGCDFILDKEYKPWLIEINSCPDLNHTTLVTAKICPAAVSDIIKGKCAKQSDITLSLLKKYRYIGSETIYFYFIYDTKVAGNQNLVIDHAADPKSPTGKFECIYRQPMTIPRYGGASDLMVRGYALPIEYFYRGNIEINEYYDNADIGKACDVKTILNKLKHFYDADIMVEPDDDSDSSKNKKQETCSHNTESDYELSVAASVITGQLDELLDRIISERSSKSASKLESLSSSPQLKPVCPVQSVKSVTDIKSLLRKSLSRFASIEAVNVKLHQIFKFSKLDDGPMGKGSFIEDNSNKNIFDNLSSVSKVRNKHQHKERKKYYKPCKSVDHMLQATSKMVSFIHQKESEYSNEVRIKHP